MLLGLLLGTLVENIVGSHHLQAPIRVGVRDNGYEIINVREYR